MSHQYVLHYTQPTLDGCGGVRNDAKVHRIGTTDPAAAEAEAERILSKGSITVGGKAFKRESLGLFPDHARGNTVIDS